MARPDTQTRAEFKNWPLEVSCAKQKPISRLGAWLPIIAATRIANLDIFTRPKGPFNAFFADPKDPEFFTRQGPPRI